uniref:Uncharacterized protein n=1 Tax=Caenorhabditis japonica TaxID=281687 RepID=A0A8R1ECU6_CAEJA
MICDHFLSILLLLLVILSLPLYGHVRDVRHRQLPVLNPLLSNYLLFTSTLAAVYLIAPHHTVGCWFVLSAHRLISQVANQPAIRLIHTQFFVPSSPFLSPLSRFSFGRVVLVVFVYVVRIVSAPHISLLQQQQSSVQFIGKRRGDGEETRIYTSLIQTRIA